MSAFDYQAFRAGFQDAARARGIDPEKGSNSFQAVQVQADWRARLHFERASAAVHRNAELPSAWARYGGIDARVDIQARRDWWKYADYWRGRCAVTSPVKVIPVIVRMHAMILPPDVAALMNIRQEIGRSEPASRVERFREVWETAIPQPRQIQRRWQWRHPAPADAAGQGTAADGELAKAGS